MKLIVGLGNPGNEYLQTRHNMGYQVVDIILEQLKIKLKTLKHKGAFVKLKFKDQDLIILKPLTYMNLSGESVSEIMAYYKINIEDILVIYDDMDTNPGQIRLRLEGSSGGHNGIKSIIQHLGSDKFKRIRIGIGKNPVYDAINYVLGVPIKEEIDKIRESLNKAAGAALEFPFINFDKLMSKYNGKD